MRYGERRGATHPTSLRRHLIGRGHWSRSSGCNRGTEPGRSEALKFCLIANYLLIALEKRHRPSTLSIDYETTFLTLIAREHSSKNAIRRTTYRLHRSEQVSLPSSFGALRHLFRMQPDSGRAAHPHFPRSLLGNLGRYGLVVLAFDGLHRSGLHSTTEETPARD